MDDRTVQEITRCSQTRHRSHPRTLAALRDAGVATYSVDIATHATIYQGIDGSAWREPCPPGWRPLATGTTAFRAEAVRKAVLRHAAAQTPYEDFLVDLAAAGVTHYTVDLAARTCSYASGHPGEVYVGSPPVPETAAGQEAAEGPEAAKLRRASPDR